MRADQSLDDPSLDAAKEFFARLDDQIATSPHPHYVTGYLAGDLAARFYGSLRPSSLVDVFFDKRLWVPQDLEVPFEDDDGALRTLSFSRAYSPDIILTHPGYAERAQIFWIGPRGFLTVKVLSPYDLAVAKIDRWMDADREDLMMLAALEEFHSETLEELAREAINGVAGNPSWARQHLDEALQLLRNR